MSTTSKILITLFLISSFIIFATIIGSNNTCAKSPTYIAVMDMETTNLSARYANQVSNQVRSEANKNGSIRLVSQRQIINALKKEGISKSAASANNGSALKVARATGATKVITGLASRMDDVYIITLTLSDVNGGRTRQMTKNCKGNFNRFLSTSVKEAVAGILKNI